ncbi:MAG: hypothetical protein AAF467_00005, partial [Actinomycetota bacterium]
DESSSASDEAADASEPDAANVESTPSAVADESEIEGDDLEVLLAERYEAYWSAFDEARQNPSADPAVDAPDLANVAAGELLDVSYQSVIDLAEQGQAYAEPDQPAIDGTDTDTEHRVRIELVEGSIAEVRSCVVNDDVRIVVGSDEVIRDAVVTVESTSTLALTEGRWKMIRSAADKIEPGVTGCWVDDPDAYPY